MSDKALSVTTISRIRLLTILALAFATMGTWLAIYFLPAIQQSVVHALVLGNVYDIPRVRDFISDMHLLVIGLYVGAFSAATVVSIGFEKQHRLSAMLTLSLIVLFICSATHVIGAIVSQPSIERFDF